MPVTGADWTPPDCTACGRCCFSELPEYVRVFGVDTDRMDERALSFTSFIGNKLYMTMVGGHCSALVLDPIARTFKCSIYEMRPDVCRSLARGSGACRADYELKQDRPDIALERLVRASPAQS